MKRLLNGFLAWIMVNTDATEATKNMSEVTQVFYSLYFPLVATPVVAASSLCETSKI